MNDLENWQKVICAYLPEAAAEIINALPSPLTQSASELRFGVLSPLQLLCGNTIVYPLRNGAYTFSATDAFVLNAGQCDQTFNLLTGYSPYAFRNELSEGFIPLPGGYRVGIYGLSDNLYQKKQDSPAGFVFRIPRAFIGCAETLIPYIVRPDRLHSLLIVSPPAYGKTTMLRDTARILGSRYFLRVCIIDERREIAGSGAFDVGHSTVVLDGQEKSTGMMKALRTLNPQVLVTDEIGTPAELQKVAEAVNCGVAVLSSAHAAAPQDLLKRPGFAELLPRCFDGMALLRNPHVHPGFSYFSMDAVHSVLCERVL